MFAFRSLINCSVNLARCTNIVEKRLLYNSLPLFSKNFSPESSPIKVVAKKKRKISSSSEENEPSKVVKKEQSPVTKKL